MSEQENILTPEEIDAITEGVKDGSIDVDSGFNTQAKVVKHDLAHEDSTLGVNISALDMINERFMRLFRLGLVETLRTSPKMNVTRAQILTFGEYLQGLNPPLSVNVIRMNPLRGFSMLLIDPSVIFSCLDNFFGGFGKGVGELPPGRLFTPTETRIINIILDISFKSLTEAWNPLMAIEFEKVSSEINPQFAQIAAENDLVIHARFETDSGKGAKGFLDIVYPYSALKPIRDLLRSGTQTADGNEESDKQWKTELTSAVHDTSLQMSTILGNTTLSLKNFKNLTEGDLLYFNKPEQATVYINDIPTFKVDVGSQGPNSAVKIKEFINPENGQDLEGKKDE